VSQNGLLGRERQTRLLIALSVVPVALLALVRIGWAIAAITLVAAVITLFLLLRPTIARSRRHAASNRFEPGLFEAQAVAPGEILAELNGSVAADPRSALTRKLRFGLVEGQLLVTPATLGFTPYEASLVERFTLSLPLRAVLNPRVDHAGGRAGLLFDMPDGRTVLIRTVRPDALRAVLALAAGAGSR